MWTLFFFPFFFFLLLLDWVNDLTQNYQGNNVGVLSSKLMQHLLLVWIKINNQFKLWSKTVNKQTKYRYNTCPLSLSCLPLPLIPTLMMLMMQTHEVLGLLGINFTHNQRSKKLGIMKEYHRRSSSMSSKINIPAIWGSQQLATPILHHNPRHSSKTFI